MPDVPLSLPFLQLSAPFSRPILTVAWGGSLPLPPHATPLIRLDFLYMYIYSFRQLLKTRLFAEY